MPRNPHKISTRTQQEPSAPARSAPPTISGRWLLKAMGFAVVAAALCMWSTLCLLFWQGSWQLLYHPKAAVTWTPANEGLRFESIGFDATPAGTPRLHAWWIPAESDAHFTVIYLHGAEGNLGDCKEKLLALHAAKLNVFAFDYRGYGQSLFERPGEKRWREDADAAIGYLVNTRHIPANSVVLYGQGLGANLALEVAATHPELAGAVLDAPVDSPMGVIFNDARARLVPAHLLTSDRWDAKDAAAHVLIPSLWFVPNSENAHQQTSVDQAFSLLSARKERVWLNDSPSMDQDHRAKLTQWLDDLPQRRSAP